MIIKENTYHLATPDEQRRNGGKWICPECGRKTFVCYVDAYGDILDEAVGKCDRADKCAYHKPPREYFNEREAMGMGVPRPRHIQHVVKPTPQPTYIDPDIFKRSVNATMNHDNHLITFLNGVFGGQVTRQLIVDFYIGTSRYWKSATVFWQIDGGGNVHAGKIMQYNPVTGKRVKKPTSRIAWVHKAMALQGFNLSQCLFGEHLLGRHLDKLVAIVESEKTAIIAHGAIADCVWLACGGCQNLTAKMCRALRGRDVILFPDNGKFDEWREKGKQLRHLCKSVMISNVMESPYIIERWQLSDGDDIGDLLVACGTFINGLANYLEMV